MDTKRCAYCRKLARADAETCSRCGHFFTARPKGINRIVTFPDGTESMGRSVPGGGDQGGPVSVAMSIHKRSIPPASPHRAGHYSGLHPEDQPYQSTIMAVQPVLERVRAAKPADLAENMRMLSVVGNVESLVEDEQDSLVVVPPCSSLPVRVYTPERKELRKQGRFVSVALTISFLFFLIASSLLTYIFMHRKPLAEKQILSVVPNQLRVNDTFILSGSGFGPNDLISFTYDKHNEPMLDSNGKPLQTHADDGGAFSVKITVPPTWEVGQHAIFAIDIGREQSISVMATITVEQSSSAPPLLELGRPVLDMGLDVPGVVSQDTLTLINAGGRQVVWQASSDQPWLTVSPNNGSFAGSAVVQVIVNRGTLASQEYKGHMAFRQQGSSDPPLTLMVTMGVKEAPPASLTVSPAALTYVGTMTQDPGEQLITLQNSGGQAVDWSSSIGNSAAWLSISPTHDHLAAHGREAAAVSVHAQQMAVGSYQGTINLSGGANPQVTVNLTVIAPGNLIASPPSLTFAASGQSALSQPLTIQNSGGEPVDWTVSAVTADGANWLNLAPTSGHLEASQSAAITVGVDAATLNPHAYQGTLTFKYGGVTTQVTVALTVSIPPAAAISLNRSTLSFTTIKGANPTAQQFTITNSGNATLNWSVAEDQNGKTFVLVSPSSGSLAPMKSTAITISPSVSRANGGALNATITIFDSDGGTKVVGQKVNVSIVVKDQAVIGVSTNALPTFAHTSQLTSSLQTLTITNTGSQPLNWMVHSDAKWLSFDHTSGAIASGTSVVVTVSCDSSTLTPGTYPALIVVSDSDMGTQVVSQTVAVQLVVS